jgi:hypothetical protein
MATALRQSNMCSPHSSRDGATRGIRTVRSLVRPLATSQHTLRASRRLIQTFRWRRCRHCNVLVRRMHAAGNDIANVTRALLVSNRRRVRKRQGIYKQRRLGSGFDRGDASSPSGGDNLSHQISMCVSQRMWPGTSSLAFGRVKSDSSRDNSPIRCAQRRLNGHRLEASCTDRRWMR